MALHPPGTERPVPQSRAPGTSRGLARGGAHSQAEATRGKARAAAAARRGTTGPQITDQRPDLAPGLVSQPPGFARPGGPSQPLPPGPPSYGVGGPGALDPPSYGVGGPGALDPPSFPVGGPTGQPSYPVGGPTGQPSYPVGGPQGIMAIPGSIPAQQAAPPGTYFPTPMMGGSGVSGLTAEEASQLGEPGNRPPVGFNPYSWNHLYKRWPGDTQRKDFPPMRKDDSGVPGRPGSPPVGGKGGTMGTRDDRWTTPGGTNLLDKAHDAAGNRWGRPSGPAINPSGGDPIWMSKGITRSGGYKQGIHADPAIQEQIRQATEAMAAKFAAEQARLGPPGSEARIKEAQERIDATSYTPEQSAAIREGRAAEARIDPVGKAAERKERRQEGSATRKERIQERKDEATEIREAREARDAERRRPPQVPLTLEQQREQRLRERFRFDQYKYEADREFKVRAERMRIQEVAMRMTKAGVTMTPEIRGQIAKLEARRTRLESEYKISGNEIGRLRDEISDAMTPGGEKDQDDLDDIMPLLVAAERRSQDLLKRLGEITEAGAKIEAEEIKKAQELLKTGNPGLAAAASTSGSYGGGVKGGGQAAPQQGAAPQQAAPQQAAAPAVVYSSVLDKSVLVEMIESYASAKNIPIEDVYQRLGATPP